MDFHCFLSLSTHYTLHSITIDGMQGKGAGWQSRY